MQTFWRTKSHALLLLLVGQPRGLVTPKFISVVVCISKLFFNFYAHMSSAIVFSLGGQNPAHSSFCSVDPLSLQSPKQSRVLVLCPRPPQCAMQADHGVHWPMCEVPESITHGTTTSVVQLPDCLPKSSEAWHHLPRYLSENDKVFFSQN